MRQQVAGIQEREHTKHIFNNCKIGKESKQVAGSAVGPGSTIDSADDSAVASVADSAADPATDSAVDSGVDSAVDCVVVDFVDSEFPGTVQV